MLASTSRNVAKALRSVAAEVNFASASCRHAQRRHASQVYSSESRPNRQGLRTRPFAYPVDSNFRGQAHTPLTRLNMIIASELDKGHSLKAMVVAKRMKDEGITPNITTYNYLMQACAQLNLQLEARAVYDDMLAMGIQPDRHTFHQLMQALGSSEVPALLSYIKLMEEWSIRPNETTYEIIITRLVENQRLENALQYLSKLAPAGLSPTLRTAAAVVQCAADLGFPRLALDLADAFESTSIRRLESEVWVDVLVSCAEQLYAEGTERVWRKVVHEMHLLPDEGCCLQVLHTAARYGLSDLALEVIDTLKTINIVWREYHIAPVIEAMCHHGEIKEAFMMLDYMRKNDIDFTTETALPILKLVKKDVDAIDDAWEKLELIRQEGHAVDVVAFNVIVEAAVALKDLQRAVGTYKGAAQLGVTPDIDTYNILLRACIDARHRELGDRFLSDMKEAGIKPDRTTYERMVRLCLTQSMYEDAFFYLEEMKSHGIVPPLIVYDSIIRKLVTVGDTRYNIALEELKECGYEVPYRLQSFISSGGAHNGPKESDAPAEAVVL
ncbi:hypothetical protein L226DRAFT_503590 [Lentinus tigrinus ALCF2SS1-7]|uniref:Pentacotripeptide-repeat region of PRORP domain-containing protein n=1 Tax=Lentinus tigrinus ALCF2SS1-6 TaxID=1328759 RepID=A0A5C2S260_9APHY|nr:hypothetical protein L227DRAFT_655466 [Lentinus tigrinus ALCF2SS1-6]RPD78827.1 hypothetical protein L226DRAFT_503590 [Lentinus tigrinus ALCF2SS1-7]